MQTTALHSRLIDRLLDQAWHRARRRRRRQIAVGLAVMAAVVAVVIVSSSSGGQPRTSSVSAGRAGSARTAPPPSAAPPTIYRQRNTEYENGSCWGAPRRAHWLSQVGRIVGPGFRSSLVAAASYRTFRDGAEVLALTLRGSDGVTRTGLWARRGDPFVLRPLNTEAAAITGGHVVSYVSRDTLLMAVACAGTWPLPSTD